MTETISDLVRRASEPFSRAALLAWVSRHRPDVEESSVAAHVQLATADDAPAAELYTGAAFTKAGEHG